MIDLVIMLLYINIFYLVGDDLVIVIIIVGIGVFVFVVVVD